jgi:N-acetylneuraminate lyase
VPIQGLIAAPHTPFSPTGELDLAVVERQAELLARSQVSGAFVGGTTGEAHSLTVGERIALADRWLDVGRQMGLKVVIHVGHLCQRDAIALAEHAGRRGGDAIAALAPSYFVPADVSDLIRFLTPIAAAGGVPFYYYDLPMLTHVRLPMAEFLARAATDIPTLAGLKYSNPDLVQLQECVRIAGGEFDVLFGCDEFLLAAIALGVKGAVGSTYNFAPTLYRRMSQAVKNQDWESARNEQAKSVKLVRTLGRYGFLPASKAVMALCGVDCGPVRPPLRPLTEEQKRALREDLEAAGLLPELARLG